MDRERTWLFFHCSQMLLALDSHDVEFVCRWDDLELTPDEAPKCPEAYLGYLDCNEARFTAWDLGLWLGRCSDRSSWVLLRKPIGLGLAVGPLVAVRALTSDRLKPLPGGVFQTTEVPVRWVLPTPLGATGFAYVLEKSALPAPETALARSDS